MCVRTCMCVYERALQCDLTGGCIDVRVVGQSFGSRALQHSMSSKYRERLFP